MNKKIILFLCMIISFNMNFNKIKVFAYDYQYLEDYNNIEQEVTYEVYDEESKFLLETQSVMVGDIFINKMFDKYEVIFVDEENYFAVCKYVGTIEKPKITKKTITTINEVDFDKCIALYCTHNDESYETGDNTSSVYGKGGIHDIAKLLCKEFQSLGIDTIFDESLHIPHDSNAYTRSNKTAKNLLNNNKLDAIFDIHRDGASRKLYVTNDNNQERCTIRIVVGQANPNKDANLEFALYLMSVSEIVCPWLFLDIYYASGHYNQALNNKALLFEMGSHLVEKDLVKKTVPYLAKVVSTALYNTQIDQNGNLTIGKTNSDNIDSTLNNYFENSSNTIKPNIQENHIEMNNSKIEAIITAVIIFLLLIFLIVCMVYILGSRNSHKN